MSDEHQDWSHRLPIVSSWWFAPSSSLEPVMESSDNGVDERDDAFGSPSDDEVAVS